MSRVLCVGKCFSALVALCLVLPSLVANGQDSRRPDRFPSRREAAPRPRDTSASLDQAQLASRPPILVDVMVIQRIVTATPPTSELVQQQTVAALQANLRSLLSLSASSQPADPVLKRWLAAKPEEGSYQFERVRLTTLDGVVATRQVGRRTPTTAGRSVVAGGRVTRAVTYDDVGTMVSVTPAVLPDGQLLLDLQLERSTHSPAELDGGSGPESEAKSNSYPATQQLSARSQMRLIAGRPMVALSETSALAGGLVEAVVIVRAQPLGGTAATSAAARQPD